MGGAIQTSQAELEQFWAYALPGFLEYVKLHSDRVGTIEKVTSLSGIYSLTALYVNGGVEKTVLAPLSLISANAEAEAKAATAAAASANAAAASANAAAAKVTEAITDITAEKQAATEAAAAANAAANLANNNAAECAAATTKCRETITACEKATSDAEAAEKLRRQAETARVTAENARASADTARANAESARVAAENTRQNQETTRQTNETARGNAETARANAENARVTAEQARVTEYATLKQGCTEATETAISKANLAQTQANRAKAFADHPPYVSEDNYWCFWDETSGAYVKSTVYAKGDDLNWDSMTEQDKQYVISQAAEKALEEMVVENIPVATIEGWIENPSNEEAEQ